MGMGMCNDVVEAFGRIPEFFESWLRFVMFFSKIKCFEKHNGCQYDVVRLRSS